MRTGAAANAHIVYAHLLRGLAERGDLIARGLKWIERDRERAPPRNAMRALRVLLGQRLEGRLGFCRAIGHRQRRDVNLDGVADFLDVRHHRRDTADAVEANDIGAELLDLLCAFGCRNLVAQLALAM